MTKEKNQKEDRIIDLIERIGVGLLYTNSKLGQASIAKILGMGAHRVNTILKGIKRKDDGSK